MSPWMASQVKPLLVQMGGDLVHHQLGVAENHAALRSVGVQQQHQRVQLAAHGNLHGQLADVVQRDLLAVDLDFLRIAQELIGQLENRVGHGGGEQHGLPLLGHVLQNGLDVFTEAHAEHFVGLVQHDHLHIGPADSVPRRM